MLTFPIVRDPVNHQFNYSSSALDWQSSRCNTQVYCWHFRTSEVYQQWMIRVRGNFNIDAEALNLLDSNIKCPNSVAKFVKAVYLKFLMSRWNHLYS